MPSLDSMPSEIILLIVEYLPCTRNHAAALARCNHRLHALLSPRLPKCFPRAAIRWACEDGILPLLKSALGDTSDSPIQYLPVNATAMYDIGGSYYDDNDKYWADLGGGLYQQTHESLAFSGHLRTPLHMACANGHNDIVNYLLDKGAPIDGRASGCCDCASVDDYLEEEIGPGSRWEPVEWKAWEPLHIAMCYKQQSTALLLLQRGASTMLGENGDVPALHFAISNGLREVVRWFVSEHQKGKPQPPVPSQPPRQPPSMHAVHAVVLLNDFDAACAIVEDLQDMDLHVDGGTAQEHTARPTTDTPLVFAAALGNYSAARALLAMGASPLATLSLREWDGDHRFRRQYDEKDKATTVLQLAVRARYQSRRRGEVFEQSREDWLKDRREFMREVVRCGCPVGLGVRGNGCRGIPPLRLALGKREREFLVGLGADVDEVDSDESTDDDEWGSSVEVDEEEDDESE